MIDPGPALATGGTTLGGSRTVNLASEIAAGFLPYDSSLAAKASYAGNGSSSVGAGMIAT